MHHWLRTPRVFPAGHISFGQIPGQARNDETYSKKKKGLIFQALREGVSELRIDCGPGYRIYLAQRGMEIVILLAEGDKSSQTKGIKAALELAKLL